MIFRYLLVLFIFSVGVNVSTAQISDVESLERELKQRGISKEELRERLLARGIVPEDIDRNDPVQLLDLQTATRSVIEEIEAEKASARASTAPDSLQISSTEITAQELIADIDTYNDVSLAEIADIPDADLFGHNLFRNSSIKFYKKSEYLNPPSGYTLGPGDKISISIWGRTEENFNAEINVEGYIKLFKQPRLYLTGLTLEAGTQKIKAQLRKNYNFESNDFEVKVVATRSVSIFISGEVLNVGSYNISGLNTAINALSAAGGPSDIGTVRNIRLLRSGSPEKVIDVYKFLSNPVEGENYYLQDNDYIVVPLAKKVVEIRGAVNREYKYELLENETMEDLISFAGGLEVNARTKNIRIQRFENDQVVIINEDISGDRARNIKLNNGDIVTIGSVPNIVTNAVAVSGAVQNGGQFAYVDGLKLASLADKVVFEENAILNEVYVTRLEDDLKSVKYIKVDITAAQNDRGGSSNILLKRGDQIVIKAKSEFVDAQRISISGAVRNAQSFKLDEGDNLRLSDVVYLAGGLSAGATDFAYIIRRPLGSTTPEYIQIDIINAVNNPGSAANAIVKPGDNIRIFNKSTYEEDSFISVEGAVRNPQTFEFDQSLTLQDVLLQAGGLKLSAAANKIDIFRLQFSGNNKTRTLVAKVAVDENLNVISGGDLQLQPFDQIIVRDASEFETLRSISIEGEVKYPGKFFLIEDNYTIADLVADAGGVTGEAFVDGATLFRQLDDVGYIIVDVTEAMKKPSSTKNMILQAGDRVAIPKKNNLVTVVGAINADRVFTAEVAAAQKTNFAYEEGKGVMHYIDHSGGFADNADKSSVTVTYPNGEKHKVSRFLLFRNYPDVMPGSVIQINQKPPEPIRVEGQNDDESVDWGDVLANSIAQATAILSLILLVERLD